MNVFLVLNQITVEFEGFVTKVTFPISFHGVSTNFVTFHELNCVGRKQALIASVFLLTVCHLMKVQTSLRLKPFQANVTLETKSDVMFM